MDKEKKAKIEQAWIDRAKTQGYEPGSAKYKRAELEFFTGAMVAINVIFPAEDPAEMSREVPVGWVLDLLSGRPVTAR